MHLDRVLSLIAVLLGLFGAILLVKGILKLTPEIIAEQAGTYWGYNKHQLENIASQKADVVCGTWLIIFAFILQAINLIFVQEPLKIFLSHWTGIGISVAIAFLTLAIMYPTNIALTNKYSKQSKMVIAIKNAKHHLQDKKVSKSEYNSILVEADNLIGFKKDVGESDSEFLKRYFTELNLGIEQDVDLSELKQ